jgi:hypothetical protein
LQEISSLALNSGSDFDNIQPTRLEQVLRLTQKQGILELFRENGNKLTLSHILNTLYAAEYRARFSDLRREGYIINCIRGENPSNNIYELIEPLKFDNSGQGSFV